MRKLSALLFALASALTIGLNRAEAGKIYYVTCATEDTVVGHDWLELDPTATPFVTSLSARGFYPKSKRKGMSGMPGRIKGNDDTKKTATIRWRYMVPKDTYNDIVDCINQDVAMPPNYHLLPNSTIPADDLNCSSWAAKKTLRCGHSTSRQS